jgi:hypothetical protein
VSVGCVGPTQTLAPCASCWQHAEHACIRRKSRLAYDTLWAHSVREKMTFDPVHHSTVCCCRLRLEGRESLVRACVQSASYGVRSAAARKFGGGRVQNSGPFSSYAVFLDVLSKLIGSVYFERDISSLIAHEVDLTVTSGSNHLAWVRVAPVLKVYRGEPMTAGEHLPVWRPLPVGDVTMRCDQLPVADFVSEVLLAEGQAGLQRHAAGSHGRSGRQGRRRGGRGWSSAGVAGAEGLAAGLARMDRVTFSTLIIVSPHFVL